MNILLAVDGSSYTKKMLAYLATHHELLGPEHTYTVLTVQAALPTRAKAALGKAIVDAYYTEEGGKITNPVIKFLARHKIAAKTVIKVGQAGETIGRFAETAKVDLLVMGSHGHSALGSLVMGSVTTQVLAHCKVPVLLIR